jgi:hypothetical protein
MKKIERNSLIIKIMENKWLILFPFLVYFILIVIVNHNDEMFGDEGRYLNFAQNLINGFYSPINEINLWNGPGYPILLMPFIYFKLPLIFITLFNAILAYLSLIMFNITLDYYLNKKIALIFTIFGGYYFFSWYCLSSILTETFTTFLIITIIFLINRNFNKKSKYTLILIGIILGYLILTKIIFGYVLICMTIIYSFYFINNIKKNKNLKIKKVILILIVAFLTIFPYLLYTFKLTKRVFYFGNSGGMSLYWMSTPYLNEYGDWYYYNPTKGFVEIIDECQTKIIVKNHQKDFEYIYKLKGVQRDDAFKTLAINNIRLHPGKYFMNCLSNQGRLWFNLPYSYGYSYKVFKSSIVLVLYSFLLSLFLITIPLWLMNISNVKAEINFLFLLFIFYLFFTTLVSAYPRQLEIIIPIIIFFITYVHSIFTKISFSFKQ